MLMIEKLKQAFKKGYTITPITMIRKEGTETCYDTRPLYGPDGKWLSKEERGPDCGQQHVTALKCTNGSSAHKHKNHCFHRVHVNVEEPGYLFVSADGKFQARVFALAEAPKGAGWTPNWAGLQPSFKGRAPKLKSTDTSEDKEQAA